MDICCCLLYAAVFLGPFQKPHVREKVSTVKIIIIFYFYIQNDKIEHKQVNEIAWDH